MTSTTSAQVLHVRHWTETQFSFMTTRPDGLRFENGQFLTLGIVVDERPLLRAYSIASANHEEHLHFLSIKISGGPLTSRLPAGSWTPMASRSLRISVSRAIVSLSERSWIGSGA
jgi:ferredoxin/flavodoxin---NADP+ reductase